MKTHEILNISEDAYELKVFHIYFKWCNVNSVDDRDFQSLIANSTMNRWFLENLIRIESEFAEDAAPYTGLDSREDISRLWLKHTMKMLLYYSKPLINVRHQRVIGE